jgi:hypothetical protein
MTCFFKQNKKVEEFETCEDVLSVPTFYNQEYMIEKKAAALNKQNVIQVALNTIGLSLDTTPCGELPKYDIHNMGAPQVLKLGLLEGIKHSNFFELCLDEAGDPFILSVGDSDFNPDDVYYSVIHTPEKVDYCVIVKGLDPMPERVVKDTIPLIVNGEGDGVEVVCLGKFQYTTCDSKIFDYHGFISYGDPHLEDTTKDETDSAFELEHFESLIGYAFTCKKPEDVDVVFSDTSQVIVDFDVGVGERVFFSSLEITPEDGSVSLGVDVTERYDIMFEDSCTPCVLLEPEEMPILYESDTLILSVDQVMVTVNKVNSYKNTGDIDYSDECDIGGCHDDGGGGAFSSRVCDLFDMNTVVRQLNVGQDFYYKIESEPGGTNLKGSEVIHYTLTAGVPYIRPYTNPTTLYASQVIKFAGASSHIFLPFKGIALVTVDKPSIQIIKKTDTAIGRVNSGGSSFVEDHTEIIEEIAKEITLCATPIVTLDKPSNTAYYVNGVTTLIDMGDCIQDNDPTTEEDLQNTPCELMTAASSGKATIDITLPFLETDEEIEKTATLLGDKFSADYKQSVSTIPGHNASASDLGKNFNDGIINKIVWSYQDKSFYKATVTSGPFLTGVDSFNTSMWIRRTDQSLSREGIVIGDHGNGLEFKVYVRNIGTYTALNMTMSTVEVGDAVNVTIYNNPAEAYYD